MGPTDEVKAAMTPDEESGGLIGERAAEQIADQEISDLDKEIADLLAGAEKDGDGDEPAAV